MESEKLVNNSSSNAAVFLTFNIECKRLIIQQAKWLALITLTNDFFDNKCPNIVHNRCDGKAMTLAFQS